MLWGWFDPIYLLFLAPAMLLAMWAQWRVRSAYSQANEVQALSGVSGAQAADMILRSAGVFDVRIESVQGFLSDHYVPKQKILRLSPDVYSGRSLAALGIAAHEAGHALQEAKHYSLLSMRNALVPAAGLGSNLSWIIIAIGFALASFHLVMIGVFVFSAVVAFQVVNLPVEFDASRRARVMLLQTNLITKEEDRSVARVLNAAALTYVAATLSSVLTLLYFLFRAGVLRNRRD